MKWFLLFIGVIIWAAPVQDISHLRQEFPLAANDPEAAEKLNTTLAAVTTDDAKVLLAYKGAVLTLQSKFAKGVKNKRNFFKEGVEYLEYAVESEADNVEIRCLRLSVQFNAPKITGYKEAIEADKQFILKNYHSVSDPGSRQFIAGFARQSQAFTDEEKKLF